MDSIKILSTSVKMHDFSSACIYVVVDNTDGGLRNVAYCTTRDIALEMRETYCENTLGIDSDGAYGAYIFNVKYSTDCLF